jgi:peptidoglycan/xylan/chitin deacetylase (PgdA/CDA1 family)
MGFLLDNAVNPTSQLYGKVFYQGPPEGKLAALTFDDGPNPYYTWKLLRVLREKSVKANFFLIGREVEKYPELARRILREGHSIGNHTYTHANLLERRKKTIVKEIVKCDVVLEAVTGRKPLLFRSPHGFRKPVVSQISQQLGHYQVDWSLCPRDWLRPGTKRMLKLVLKKVRPGTIILLHDGGGDRSQTVEVVPLIIDRLRERGYQFVTIEELLDLH